MSIFRVAGRVVLAGMFLTGVVACGDDGEEASGSSAESPAADTDRASFCEALKTFHGAIFETQLEDDSSEGDIKAAHEKLDPLWSEVEATAPDGQSETVEKLSASIDDLAEGDASSFNADETSAIYFGMVAEEVESCVEETTEVRAVDFAFEDVPKTLPAGESGILLTNDSEDDEQHEFIVFKKEDGDDRTAQEILEDPATEESGPGEFAGAIFSGPGKTAGSFLNLQKGNYIAVCFIPVGGGEEGPPHFTRGMVAEFAVE